MQHSKLLLISTLALSFAACSPNAKDDATDTATAAAVEATTEITEAVETVEAVTETVQAEATEWAHKARLMEVLDAQDEDAKARYAYRNPVETLEFFGIEPGMVVVDMLPGQVWYAGILSDYLGLEGRVIGVDYPTEMFNSFNVSEERKAERKLWTQTFPTKLASSADRNDAPVFAIRIGEISEDLNDVADVALIIRGLHGAHRLSVTQDKPYLNDILSDLRTTLKPGGKLGIIQHRAPEESADDWANGANGYLKQSRVIEFVEAAGFKLVAASEINANPLDKPTEADRVWRLPPTLGVKTDEEKAANKAIGESDRMTLLFEKTAS